VRHPPQPGLHLVEWSCELVGTAILVLGGLSAVVADFGPGSRVARLVPSHSWRLLITGVVFAGFGSLVAVSPLGRRSGAHLNPALSFAFWCERHLHLHDLAGYIAAQCLGALLGAGLLRLAWQSRAAGVDYGVTRPGGGLDSLEAAGVEALMTGLLVLVIFAFVSSTRTARLTPLAVWIVVAVLVWQGAPYTGTSLNPARSLGPALVAGHWADYWVYLLGPLTGAAAAVGCWTLVPRVTLTAKLFHDSRYPSTLGSHLPVAAQHGSEPPNPPHPISAEPSTPARGDTDDTADRPR
jgi:aquaporin Z